MTKEEKYEQCLRELGVWHPSFAATVHDLCVLEREQSRARAEWKRSAENGNAPSVANELYAIIRQQGKDIAALRDSLGLTPKSLRRVKGTAAAEDRRDRDEAPTTVLELVRNKYA